MSRHYYLAAIALSTAACTNLSPNEELEIQVSEPLGLDTPEHPKAFHREGSGFVARHRSHAAEVSARGLRVTPQQELRQGAALELETREVRRLSTAREELDALPDVAEDGSLRMARGEAIEEIADTEAGVEQSWRFARRPAGSGDLLVSVAVRGQEFLDDNHSGLHFVDRRSGLGVRYSHATWVDGNGEKTALRCQYQGGRIEILVPSALVEQSAYPAVLDPTVSAEFVTNAAPLPQPTPANQLTQQNSSVAFDGTNFLVVWEEDRAGFDVYGLFFNLSGQRVGTPFVISNAQYDQTHPAVAFTNGTYLVTWQDARNSMWGPNYNVYGTLVSPAGQVGTSFAISATPQSNPQNADWGWKVLPSVAPSGTNFQVVWENHAYPVDQPDVKAQLVSAQGALLGTTVTVTASSTVRETVPSVACTSVDCLVAWQENVGSANTAVKALRLDATGAVLGSVLELDSNVTSLPVQNPKLGTDGTNYLAVWEKTMSGNTRDIYARRVLPMSLSAIFPVYGVYNPLQLGQTTWRTTPTLAFDGTHFIVVFVVGANGAADLKAGRIKTIGDSGSTAKVDSAIFTVSAAQNGEFAPAMATNRLGKTMVTYHRYLSTRNRNRVDARIITTP